MNYIKLALLALALFGCSNKAQVNEARPAPLQIGESIPADSSSNVFDWERDAETKLISYASRLVGKEGDAIYTELILMYDEVNDNLIDDIRDHSKTSAKQCVEYNNSIMSITSISWFALKIRPGHRFESIYNKASNTIAMLHILCNSHFNDSVFYESASFWNTELIEKMK